MMKFNTTIVISTTLILDNSDWSKHCSYNKGKKKMIHRNRLVSFMTVSNTTKMPYFLCLPLNLENLTWHIFDINNPMVTERMQYLDNQLLLWNDEKNIARGRYTTMVNLHQFFTYIQEATFIGYNSAHTINTQNW